MKVVGVIQARTKSTRLPGKVLRTIAGRAMVWWVHQRLSQSAELDTVVVSVPPGDDDLLLRGWLTRMGIPYVEGPENDFVSRFYGAGCLYRADAVVRITADCPLIDPAVVDRIVRTFSQAEFDYVSNSYPPTFPDGQDVEVVSMDLLRRMDREMVGKDREFFNFALWNGSFPAKLYTVVDDVDRSQMRWTVDYEEDLKFVEAVLLGLGPCCSMQEIIRWLATHPEVVALNAMHARPSGVPEHDQARSNPYV